MIYLAKHAEPNFQIVLLQRLCSIENSPDGLRRLYFGLLCYHGIRTDPKFDFIQK